MHSLMRSGTVVGLLLALTHVVRALPADSAKGPDSSETRPVKSTQTAVLASLLLPGLGQAYTENYWKIPLFTGTAAFSAVLFFQNNAEFSTASAEYDKAVGEGAGASTVNLLLRRREVFRDNRDISAVVFLITYALAAVDAYVGAELYSFDTGEQLSLNLGSTPSQSIALSLRMTW